MKRSLIERLEAIDTTHGDAKEAAVYIRKLEEENKDLRDEINEFYARQDLEIRGEHDC